MKLVHKKIPAEFIKNIPKGIKYVHKKSDDYLVVEQLFCSNGHSLMVDNVRLHGESSIKLKLKIGEIAGSVFVDAFWGLHDKLYSFLPDIKDLENPDNDALCPVCDCSLMIEHDPPCKTCGTNKFVELLLPGGFNKIIVCSKLGCPEHELIARDFDPQVSEQVSDINFFGL